MKTRCFVDVNGHIWSINQSGESNFPGDIKIEGNTVLILGAKDDLGDGRPVDEEYQLWQSLTDLAIALEQELPSSNDGSVSLVQAVASVHQQVNSFEKWWISQNAENPDLFPMVLTQDNSGAWFEQIKDFCIN